VGFCAHWNRGFSEFFLQNATTRFSEQLLQWNQRDWKGHRHLLSTRTLDHPATPVEINRTFVSHRFFETTRSHAPSLWIITWFSDVRGIGSLQQSFCSRKFCRSSTWLTLVRFPLNLLSFELGRWLSTVPLACSRTVSVIHSDLGLFKDRERT
jgi:hypothetical protein